MKLQARIPNTSENEVEDEKIMTGREVDLEKWLKGTGRFRHLVLEQ